MSKQSFQAKSQDRVTVDLPTPADIRRSNKQVIKALVIGDEGSVRKAEDQSSESASKLKPQEEYWQEYLEHYIRPPIDPEFLALVEEYSTILHQCIETMEVNIEGFGYMLKPLVPRGKLKEQSVAEMDEEQLKIENFLNTATGRDSLVTFRRRIRHDLEATGNAFFELTRHPLNKRPQRLIHAPSYQIRLSKVDQEFTEYTLKQQVKNGEGGYEIQETTDLKRFRRFMQLQYGIYGGPGIVWFKEYGDPRPIDSRTGEVVSGSKMKSFPANQLATEMIHLKIYSPRSPYGLPRYKGALITLLGDREAEEVNYTTLKSNNIPSMVVAVSNGQLTNETVDRMRQFVKEQIQGSKNYSRFLILEAEGVFEGTDPGQIRLDIKPLAPYQTKDQLFQEYGAANRNKIRQAFRLPPIILGDSEDYTRSCYSEDTETLTENGWKYFHEVEKDEQIATFNPETCGLEYHTPISGLLVHDYDGLMFHFKNRNTDILVTPDHTMWVKPVAGKEYGKQHAEDIEFSRFKFRSSPDSYSSSIFREHIKIPEMELKDGPNAGIRKAIDIPIKLWVEFVSAFVADGSTTPEFVRNKKRCMYAVSMSAKKERKTKLFSRLYDGMKALGFNVHNVCYRSDGIVSFCLSDKVLWKMLRTKCGTKAIEKKLPAEFQHYPKDLLEASLEVLKNTDGTVNKHCSSWSYSTTSRTLADQVQTIAMLLGHRANLIVTKKRKPNHNDVYRVLVTPDKTEHKIHAEQVDIEWYTGKVYCFEVPNHLFFTRRGGRIAIQGNTSETSRRLADEQIFRPERDEMDNLFNSILYEFDMKYHIFRSNGPNVTDDEDLLKLLVAAEKTGGMTPEVAREIIADILGRPASTEWNPAVKPDIPFSLQMAEAVKNQAQANEVGQQVTALKRQPEPVDALAALMALRDQMINELNQRGSEED